MKRLLLIFIACLLLCSTVQAASSHIDLPKPLDVVMLAGSDFSLTLKHTDEMEAAIDITGYAFAAQFRSAPAPGGILFATYSTSITNPVSGLFQVSLSKFQTLTLSGKSGVWDLFQVDTAGKVTYLLSGKAAVRPTATRYP
jgi:hypothetical protein